MNQQLTRLEKQFKTFEQFSDGVLGIHGIHIETGKEVLFNAEELFLMCSTYKIPMAIHLLQKVERGELNLTNVVEISADTLRPGIASTLTQLNYIAPVHMSIGNLLQFMMQESCNTATDILLNMVGGPNSIKIFLDNAGIQNMRVDRYTIEVLADWDGIKNLPQDHKLTVSQYKEMESGVSPTDSQKAREIFKADVKDRTTPMAMTQLLIKLFKNELINEDYTNLLLKIMRRCKTGPSRLMGLLPQSTSVAHKTGTLTGYLCDVGIITLPDNAGHIAISTYIKNSTQETPNNERVLAEVGRTLYDYYLII